MDSKRYCKFFDNETRNQRPWNAEVFSQQKRERMDKVHWPKTSMSCPRGPIRLVDPRLQKIADVHGKRRFGFLWLIQLCLIRSMVESFRRKWHFLTIFGKNLVLANFRKWRLFSTFLLLLTLTPVANCNASPRRRRNNCNARWPIIHCCEYAMLGMMTERLWVTTGSRRQQWTRPLVDLLQWFSTWSRWTTGRSSGISSGSQRVP